jgi:glutamate transport system permease protein
MSGSVLYDAPGPRARTVNLIASLVGVALLLWIAWVVYSKFDETGQWDGDKWSPFLEADMWDAFLVPGILGTLRAFALASILALAFGLLFGVGRMSQHAAVRWLSGGVVEFFRSIPLLLLMFFLYFMQEPLGLESNIYMAVVLGLMLYNGSVLAEVIRAGVNSLPKGQREAGLAVGLSQAQAMRTILLPQAMRAMLPAVIAQLVVLLKDTALGYILAYDELLNQLSKIDVNYHNLIPAAIVIALIYIAMNSSLSRFATWLEKYMRTRGHTAGPVGHADQLMPGGTAAALPGAGMPGGGGV